MKNNKHFYYKYKYENYSLLLRNLRKLDTVRIKMTIYTDSFDVSKLSKKFKISRYPFKKIKVSINYTYFQLSISESQFHILILVCNFQLYNLNILHKYNLCI